MAHVRWTATGDRIYHLTLIDPLVKGASSLHVLRMQGASRHMQLLSGCTCLGYCILSCLQICVKLLRFPTTLFLPRFFRLLFLLINRRGIRRMTCSYFSVTLRTLQNPTILGV